MAASSSSADEPREPSDTGVGLAHLTVVPTNFDADANADGDDTEK